MSESVVLDVELSSPITKVWSALTDSATLSKWMMFKSNDFQPVLGHSFHFKDAPGYDGVIQCEVTEVDPPKRLAYTWSTVGQDDEPHSTVVTWSLTEGANGVTHLHLEQSGFHDDAQQELGGAEYGWQMMLEQLESVLTA